MLGFVFLFLFFSLLLSGFSFQLSSCSSLIARLRLHIIHSTRASLVQLLSCLLSKQTKLAGKPYKFSLFTCSVLSFFFHAFVKIFIIYFYDPASLSLNVTYYTTPKASSPLLSFALLHAIHPLRLSLVPFLDLPYPHWLSSSLSPMQHSGIHTH